MILGHKAFRESVLIPLQNDSTPESSIPRPNPMNVSNLAKIQDLEQQIARYELFPSPFPQKGGTY